MLMFKCALQTLPTGISLHTMPGVRIKSGPARGARQNSQHASNLYHLAAQSDIRIFIPSVLNLANMTSILSFK